ncbi:uncharacterized protein PV07_09748 [Cladophialophora immunda]|uniref:Zn(2)-C6 fungal-type domain-containing protein n=1 Tax=Cladophialophora immunda TaxID=569365 RepID=A0A0D2CKH8_9EURO|nr:uncharacterized protein PV07_09748 [Cladophialophora immunda]KIW24009.1 hypothetical protein PV07_09748 [Cladophialophora immunda]OQV01858.1 Fungal Zn2-Cys6 binuclear cluster domain-containing protein [Cladophialophora immunda]
MTEKTTPQLPKVRVLAKGDVALQHRRGKAKANGSLPAVGESARSKADDNRAGLAFTEVKPRIKQLHHKVRSGCTTCKHRRIKCDEHKPSCKRCTRSGRVCLGYNPPRPWIFEGVEPKKRAATSALESESGGNPDSSSWQDPYLAATIDVLFGDTDEERRSLDFWLRGTGPTLGNFGPDNDFWCCFVPRWAWQSPIVRHLMVAAALVDEQLGLYRKATTSRVTPRVIWHYHAAITRMANAKAPDKVNLTVACLVAWVCETMQRNYAVAGVHIKAASRLWGEIKASSDKLPQSMLDTMAPIERAVRLCDSYTKAVLAEDPPSSNPLMDGTGPVEDTTGDVPVVHSLRQARGLLLESIAAFSAKEWTDADARRQRLYIRNWHQAIRRYCSYGTESRLHKITVQMLFNVGMAFLPESEAGTFSHYANPKALKHILEIFERISAEKRKEKPSLDGDEIEVTLVSALEVMMNNIYHDNLYQRCEQLRGALGRPCADSKRFSATANGDLNSQSDHIAQVLTLLPDQWRRSLRTGRI